MAEKFLGPREGGDREVPYFIPPDTMTRILREQGLELDRLWGSHTLQRVITFSLEGPEYREGGDSVEGAPVCVVVEKSLREAGGKGGLVQWEEGRVIATRGPRVLLGARFWYSDKDDEYEEKEWSLRDLDPFTPLHPRQLEQAPGILLRLMQKVFGTTPGSDVQQAASDLLELLGLFPRLVIGEDNRGFASAEMIFAPSDPREPWESGKGWVPPLPNWEITIVSGLGGQDESVVDFRVWPRWPLASGRGFEQGRSGMPPWLEVTRDSSGVYLAVYASEKAPLTIPDSSRLYPLRWRMSLEGLRIPDPAKGTILDHIGKLPPRERPNLALMETVLKAVVKRLRPE